MGRNLGRRCLPFLIVSILGLSACKTERDAGGHDVLGVVSQIPDDGQSLVVSHETIPGYMQAMVMPFAVSDPAILEGLEAGDEIRFHLVVGPDRVLIDRIDRFQDTIEAFPQFVLETLDGQQVSSSLLEGKVSLVNFWASWCGPCKVEMPWLVEIQADYAGQGFRVIGIATDPDSRDAISGLVAQLDVNYTILLSDGDIEAAVGGVYAIPTTFILDREGGVRHRHVGLIQKEVLQDEIRLLF